MQESVFTIGHSTHPIEQFIALLKRHGITALCDVRSKPYSQMNPQFNREKLKQALRKSDIAYVFLGAELGARSDDPACYKQGKVQYDRLAETPLFCSGIDRVQEGMKTFRVALMCAEKDPLECHRTILVARQLEARGLDVHHILANGELESHAQTISRLIRELGMSESDMFRSREETLSNAYILQGGRIAYSPNDTQPAQGDASKSVAR